MQSHKKFVNIIDTTTAILGQINAVEFFLSLLTKVCVQIFKHVWTEMKTDSTCIYSAVSFW